MRRSIVPACAVLAVAPMLSLGCDGGSSEEVRAWSPGDVPAAPPAPQPAFGPLVEAAVPPPPISGGTLLVTHGGYTAVAADPDRDLVYVVDLASRRLARTIALQPGDEPGRVAEDGGGRVHVALRGGGALVTLDPATGAVLARRPVCPAPRGVAWDETTDTVVVACATGEVVTLPSAGGPPTRTVTVERDLRDVLVRKGVITVSTFRSSEVLELATDGAVLRRFSVASPQTTAELGPMAPHVAWRTFASPSGGTVVVHQLHAALAIPTSTFEYYCACGSAPTVIADMTFLGPDGDVVSDELLAGDVLPVDVAISPDGRGALVAAPGNAFLPDRPPLRYVALGTPVAYDATFLPPFQGTPIAVAFDAGGEALAQTREPAALWLVYPGGATNVSIPLSSRSRDDTGHDVFHAQTGGFIACASCHPEGGDDGHVWNFGGSLRRTASLRGIIAGTAPYHWQGDEADFPALVADVYTKRMGGAALGADVTASLERWVQAIPAPPSPSWIDAASAARGQALFESAATGCTSCHTDPGSRTTRPWTSGRAGRSRCRRSSASGGAHRSSTTVARGRSRSGSRPARRWRTGPPRP